MFGPQPAHAGSERTRARIITDEMLDVAAADRWARAITHSRWSGRGLIGPIAQSRFSACERLIAAAGRKLDTRAISSFCNRRRLGNNAVGAEGTLALAALLDGGGGGTLERITLSGKVMLPRAKRENSAELDATRRW